jgi:nuclear pore complex protein Nup62
MSFGSGSLNFGGSSLGNPGGLNLGGASGGTNTGFSLGSLNKPATQSPLSFGASSTTNTSGLAGGLGSGLGGGLGLGAKPAFSLGGLTTAATSAPVTATLTTGVVAQSNDQQQQQQTNSSISYKVLEDYINKWMTDLDVQEKDFLNQATQLNALDKLMIENGEKIIEVSSEATRLNNEQEKLEQELNFIYSTQNDLELSIKKLEMGIEQMPLIPQQSSDTSRIEMYKMLIEVDNQIKSTSIDLKDIIKSLNDTNVNLNDPVVQISKILNAHVDSLNWIEENSVNLQQQVDKIAKAMDDRNRETEYNTSKLYFN